MRFGVTDVKTYRRYGETRMKFDPRTEYQDGETAEVYDAKRFRSLSGRLFQWSERKILQRVLKTLPAGSLVMDAPCGTGRFQDLFLSAGMKTLGADISG